MSMSYFYFICKSSLIHAITTISDTKNKKDERKYIFKDRFYGGREQCEQQIRHDNYA